MEEQKIIPIKVQVDKSDVDKSFKDVERQANTMSSNMSKSNNKTGQSFNHLGRQMQNAFKRVNINGLTSSMARIKTTVAKTMKQVKSNIQSSLSAFNSSKLKMPKDNTKLPTSNPTDNSIPKQLSLIDKMKKNLKEWANQHKKTANQIKNANKGLTTSFKSLLSAMIPFLSIYAIFSGLKNAINDAMESIETDNMFNTVFGSSATEMSNWVGEVNKTLGLGITNTKQYTATISQMGRAMGLTGQQAMEMSKQMALMAGDISSFYNTDLASVQADLRSALSGSYETMDKYGILLRATTIQQYAYANGIANTGAELTNAQRAMATTMMIEEQLGLANGDLARSINSPANQARILKSNLSDLSVALGKCFMPILTVVLPILNNFVQALTTTINAIANFISQVFALFGVNVDFGGVGGAVNDMASSIESADVGSGGLSDNLASGADSAKEIQKFLSGIDELNIVTTKQDSGSSGSGGISGGNIDTGAIDSGMAQVETKFSKWAEKVKNALQSVWTSLKDGWSSVGDYINGSLDKLKQSFANLGKSIESFLIGCWNNGGEELIYNIGRLAGAFTGLALDIGGQVVDSVAKLFDHMNPDNNVNTRKFIKAMNEALESCQNFALSAGGWLKTFMDNGGQEFLDNMGDICTIIGTTLVDAVGDGIQAITDFLNSTQGQEVIKTFASVLEDLSEKLESMSLWVSDNIGWLTVLGGVIVGITAGMKLGAKAIEGISLAFQGWGWISGFVAVVSGALTNLWNVVLIPLYDAIMVGLGAIASFFGVSVGWVVVAIGVLVGACIWLWQNWDTIKEKCAELWQGLQTYWSYISTIVINKCTEIKDKAVEIWTNIKEWVITKVTDIKDDIKDKFEQAYTTVTDVFTKIKTKISETIGGARDSVKEAIDKIKGFFNFEWSLPKLKLPKISISGSFSLNPISVPSFGISWHRQGGILPAGSNAIFGMNGNNLMAGGEISTGGEAILPLSDLFKEMKGMFDNQNRQLVSQLKGNNQPINLVLNIDGQTLAKKQFKSFQELYRLGIVDFSELT